VKSLLLGPLLLALAGGAAGPPTEPVSVLFVGNSLTYTNDLPGLARSFAAAAPRPVTLFVHSVTPGGVTLEQLWSAGDAVRALRSHRPQVLVLQGQSTEPVLGPEPFARNAALFKAEAERIGAQTVLLETWARPRGDPFYDDPASGRTPEEMQRRLSRAYESLGALLNVPVARVGEAFRRAGDEVPGVPLLDGSQHPTLAGSYLAAAVLYRTLFHASPVGSTFTAGLPRPVAAALQSLAASRAVAPAPPGQRPM
jgi:hypothetical protein